MVPFPDQYWGKLSPESKDLVSKMLIKDQNERISAAEGLQHPWFSLNVPVNQKLDINFDEFSDANLTDE